MRPSRCDGSRPSGTGRQLAAAAVVLAGVLVGAASVAKPAAAQAAAQAAAPAASRVSAPPVADREPSRLRKELLQDLLAPRHEGRDRVFARVLGPEGHRALEEWLAGDDPKLRAAAAGALGRIWEEIPAWTGEIRAREDPAGHDPHGRRRAIDALIASLRREGDARARHGEVWALARIGEPARMALQDAAAEEPEGALATVMDSYRRERVIPALASTLHYGTTEGFYEGRYEAVQALGPEVVPLLSELGQDPRVHFEIRDSAVNALGVLADPASAGVLESFLVPVDQELQEFSGPGIFDRRMREYVNRIRLSQSARRALVRVGHPEALRERLEALLAKLDKAEEDANGSDEKTSRYWQIAYDYQKLGETEKAKEYYHLQIEHSGKGPSSRSNIAHYNLACLAAKEGQMKEALHELAKAVRAGFTDRDWMNRDGDLLPLHGLAEFQSILDSIGEVDEGDPQGEDS